MSIRVSESVFGALDGVGGSFGSFGSGFSGIFG